MIPVVTCYTCAYLYQQLVSTYIMLIDNSLVVLRSVCIHTYACTYIRMYSELNENISTYVHTYV